jgi:protein-S-isoprenylcysteine O-methyltransferase Ste14
VRDEPAPIARLFSWAGALLFFLALAYFLFSYLTTFGIPAPGAVDAAAITWDVALFTIFALHHSVFARLGVRDWLARRVSRDLERPVYVWIASLLFLGVCALWKPVAGIVWSVGDPARWALWGLQAAGVWLTLRSAKILDVRELAGLKPVARTANTRPPEIELSTDGPYGWVRHPIYLGWFLMVLPVPVMTMTRLVFAVVSCLYLVIAIPIEEASIRRSSNGGYDRYMRAVRWRLIPGLY